MKKLTYKITLLELLYARALGGEPNSGVSLPYVPGGLVRSALLLKHTSSVDSADPDLRRQFFDGSTQFCNAFPVFGTRPVTQTPHSWQQEKGVSEHAFDFLISEPDWQTASNCRTVKKSFFAEDSNKITFVSPYRILTVHNRRHRNFGRPVERQVLDDLENDDPGIIFRFEALAPQQFFLGEIVGNEADLKIIASLLNGEIHLGGSRSAGYGQAKIEQVGTINDIENTLPTTTEYTITFASDALLRDKYGQYSSSSDTILLHITKKLGSGVILTCENAFLGQTIVGGFNRKWGLPLPQCVAVAMGSVLRIKIENGTPDTVKRLHDIVMQGIGERRAEGFGRLKIAAFDPSKARLSIKSMNGTPDKEVSSVPTEFGDDAEAIAMQMLERHFRNWIEARMTSLIPQVNPGNITGSQIARLRNVVQQQLTSSEPNPGLVSAFIDKIESRQRIRTKFDGAKPPLNWFKATLSKKEKGAWQEIFDASARRASSIGNFSYDPADNESLRIEFLLRYIDLIFAKLAKAVQKKETGGGQ